jgi:CRP/FNR family cyclic AMP-dependent transcriptional regulator
MASDDAAYLEFLARVPMFAACSAEDLAVIARLGVPRHVGAGEILTEEGDAGSEFFVIVAGRAEVSRKRSRIATLERGDFFGELALLDDLGVRDATVIAITPMEVLMVMREEFHALLQDVPTITGKILTGMARRLRDADTLSRATDRRVPTLPPRHSSTH